MAEANSSGTSDRGPESSPRNPPQPQRPASAKIHRVCIGCNNMFEVTIENYELKHCPVCRRE